MQYTDSPTLRGKTSESKEYLILRISAMKAAANPQTIFRQELHWKFDAGYFARPALRIENATSVDVLPSTLYRG